VLERLAGREEPLTQLMARQAGAREARWVHLLSGPVDAGVVAEVRGTADVGGGGLAGRVAALEELVRALEERMRMLERGGGEADSQGE
jgi:uncharacterized protein YceH (UPF0502 family)